MQKFFFQFSANLIPSRLRFHGKSRNPTIPEALLIWFSVLFFWHFVFSYFLRGVDNIDFLKYGVSSASIYCFAKHLRSSDRPFGRPLDLSDAPSMSLSLVASFLVGVGCWALLIYLEANLTGSPATYQHRQLMSHADFIRVQWSTPWLIGDLLTSSALVPISEEIIFRGFILRRLLARHGLVFAVFMSACLFSLFHLNKSFIGVFVQGIILSILAIRTSSLYAPMLVHGLYNATVSFFDTAFGLSIVADEKRLSLFSYWTPEIVCGVVGLFLFTAYLLRWPVRTESEAKQR